MPRYYLRHISDTGNYASREDCSRIAHILLGYKLAQQDNLVRPECRIQYGGEWNFGISNLWIEIGFDDPALDTLNSYARNFNLKFVRE